MQHDTKIVLGSVGAAALLLIGLGVVFFQTGSKLASALAIGSPVLLVVGIFLFKRGLVSTARYSLPVQLKAQSVTALVHDYNAVAVSIERACRTLELPRERLPTLSPVFDEIKSFVKATGDPNRPLEVKSQNLDGLELANLEKLKRTLLQIRDEADKAVQESLDTFVGSLQKRQKALNKMGLTRLDVLASTDGSSAPAQLESVLSRTKLVVQESVESLGGTLDIARRLYKDVAEEERMVNQAREAAAADQYGTAFGHLVAAGESLSKKVAPEFHEAQKGLLETVLAVTESPGRSLVPQSTARRIDSMAALVESLQSPLQLGKVEASRQGIADLADLCLADLERLAASDTQADSGVAEAYAKAFPNERMRPTAENFDKFQMDWQPRFEFLVTRLKKAKVRQANDDLYLRLESRMKDILREKGSISARDLKLMDAQEIFERYMAENPGTEIRQGMLVQAAEAAARKKRAVNG